MLRGSMSLFLFIKSRNEEGTAMFIQPQFVFFLIYAQIVRVFITNRVFLQSWIDVTIK